MDLSLKSIYDSWKKLPMKLLKTERAKEELQRLCAKIITICNHKGLRTIMIASCNKGEGASTIAINFSRIFAQEIKNRVLLVDANLHHPAIDKAFKVERAPGLIDFISGKVDLEAIIQKTGIKNLYLMAVGNCNLNPISLFNSEDMNNYLEKLKKGFDFIVFDSAPIIPYSDSLYLSTKVDIVILVIEAEKTRWEVAQEAIQKLENIGSNVFGAILNKKKYYIPNIIYKKL